MNVALSKLPCTREKKERAQREKNEREKIIKREKKENKKNKENKENKRFPPQKAYLDHQIFLWLDAHMGIRVIGAKYPKSTTTERTMVGCIKRKIHFV